MKIFSCVYFDALAFTFRYLMNNFFFARCQHFFLCFMSVVPVDFMDFFMYILRLWNHYRPMTTTLSMIKCWLFIFPAMFPAPGVATTK